MNAVSAIKQGIMMVVIDAILKKMNGSVELILERKKKLWNYSIISREWCSR